jgi:SAM-dependent methyltransferase
VLTLLNYIRTLKKVAMPIAKMRHVSKYSVLLEPYVCQGAATGSRALDLGCGVTPKNPFGAESVFGVDLSGDKSKNVYKADLTLEPIPFEDGFFSFVTAFDFLEHVPRVVHTPSRSFPFVNLMNEVWRVLDKGGYFLSYTPVYPYASVFQDPTHVNFITVDTFSKYFDDKFRFAAIYGFNGRFEVVCQGVEGERLVSVLRKVA